MSMSVCLYMYVYVSWGQLVNHGRLFNIPVASKTSGSAKSSDS